MEDSREAGVEKVVYLTDDIENNDVLTPRVAVDFLKQLHQLDKHSGMLTVHMYCSGGDWHAGLVIYDAILTAANPTTIVVHGCASSMATIILQAARWRILQPHSELLVHWGEDTITGERLAVASQAKFSTKKQSKKMLDIYTARCSEGAYFKDKNMNLQRTARYIENTLMAKTDWYLSAKEAVLYGFADKIIAPTKNILLL